LKILSLRSPAPEFLFFSCDGSSLLSLDGSGKRLLAQLCSVNTGEIVYRMNLPVPSEYFGAAAQHPTLDFFLWGAASDIYVISILDNKLFPSSQLLPFLSVPATER
jgi:hypothetical protein